MSKINRVILFVLDSFGIGALPDADKYGDEDANTFRHVFEAAGGCNVPNMIELGLSNISLFKGIDAVEYAKGAYGRSLEVSPGKDTTTGHWEMMGIQLDKPFPTYPNGFPSEIIEPLEEYIGKKILGNKPASGTEIIDEYGEVHMQTGRPIVYTSADSVYQIAAHEEVIPLEKLYECCKFARSILTGEHAMGRVIARPFVGKPGSFTRTPRRHDYSLQPLKESVLDKIKDNQLPVIGVGKIEDIFCGQGLTDSIHTKSNMHGVDCTIEKMRQYDKGFIFTNLVDFDMKYGHRKDSEGYRKALEDFDARLPEIYEQMNEDDVLIICADHGCDPETKGTDHTREYIPILIYGDNIQQNVDLGTRETFADIGATVLDMLGCETIDCGASMLPEIQKGNA